MFEVRDAPARAIEALGEAVSWPDSIPESGLAIGYQADWCGGEVPSCYLMA